MSDIYAEEARARRTPALQSFLDNFAKEFDIGQDYMDACEHPYDCACNKCLGLWATMGPKDDEFGPFTQEQVEAYCKENDMPVWW